MTKKEDDSRSSLKSRGIYSSSILKDLPPETSLKIAKYQFIYSLSGLIVGISCIIGGFILAIRGIQGKIDWVTKILGSESKIFDASPGAIMLVVGLFIIYITRFFVKYK